MDTQSNITIDRLRQRLAKPLPHLESHIKVAVSSRLKNIKSKSYKVPENARQSAILISLFETEGILKFPLILRNTYDGVHSNQIGLPGGKLEKGENHQEAALREFQEELGYKVDSGQLLGHLSSVYIPPSNFNLKPYISYSEEWPLFIPDSKEVAEIFISSIPELLESSIVQRDVTVMKNRMTVKCFILQDQVVWGATAAILSEFRDLLLEISL